MSKTEIFISYAWGDEKEAGISREKIVDDLIPSLAKDNYEIIRDKTTLTYTDLISGFMDRIGDGFSIILVISDKYLRSRYCLYEFLQIFRNAGSDLRKMQPKIFPLILDDARIYSDEDRKGYVRYWETEQQTLIDNLSTLTPANRKTEDSDLSIVQEIGLHIGAWMKFLADMVIPGGVAQMAANDFEKLKAHLTARLEGLSPASFNLVLIRRLIEGLAPYDEAIQQVLNDASRLSPAWEKDLDNRLLYREKIIEAFPGTIGNQIGTILGIGSEPQDTEDKYRRHQENCMLAAKRTLQLLYFTFLVKLWDYKIKESFALTPEETSAIGSFFKTSLELRLVDYHALLQTMIGIFGRLPEHSPIAEIDQLQKAFAAESPLSHACIRLQSMQGSGYSRQLALEAEKEIAGFFSTLAFISAYKMVSLKNIGYYSLRNTIPHYLHEYAPVGILETGGQTRQKKKVKYIELPCNNDAVMWFRDDYWKGLNLFPFVIDLNAINNEEYADAQILFYCSRNRNSFNFGFSENDMTKISGSEEEILDQMFNQLMLDKEGKVKINRYNIVRQLEEAQTIILKA